MKKSSRAGLICVWFISALSGLAQTLPSITNLTAPRQILAAGQSLTLSVTAINATSYQWKRNGAPIAGATGTNYTITKAAPLKDNGWYNVEVNSSNGSATISILSATIFVSVIQGGGFVPRTLAWGNNNAGQTTIPPGRVISVAAGSGNTMALKQNGSVIVWGAGSAGQLKTPAGLSGVKAIAAGGDYELALKQDGSVVAWGNNYEGQATVPAGLSGVMAIAAGGVHSMALKQDGTVVAWGRNDAGQTSVPVGLTGVIAVAAGNAHSVALKQDG